MPDLVNRLTSQLIRKGTPAHKAKRVAIIHLQKSGLVDQAGKLTPLGEHRSKMSPQQRAFSRKKIDPASGALYDPYDNTIKE
jgi:hypothetical protein